METSRPLKELRTRLLVRVSVTFTDDSVCVAPIIGMPLQHNHYVVHVLDIAENSLYQWASVLQALLKLPAQSKARAVFVRTVQAKSSVLRRTRSQRQRGQGAG